MNNWKNNRKLNSRDRAINRILDIAWDDGKDLTWQQGFSIWLRSRELKAETEGDQNEKDREIEQAWKLRRDQKMSQGPRRL